MDRVTGVPWQELLDSALFFPLGKRRTTALMSRAGDLGGRVPYLGGVDKLPSRPRVTKRDEAMHPPEGWSVRRPIWPAGWRSI